MTRPRSQSGTDADVQLVAMCQGLVDIPDDAIEAGCTSWATDSQWFPTLSEIRNECLKHRTSPPGPQLPPPSKDNFSDKKWWYRRCRAFPYDIILQARAREIYPTMFAGNGALLDAGQVNFQARDKVAVHPNNSPTYRAMEQVEAAE